MKKKQLCWLALGLLALFMFYCEIVGPINIPQPKEDTLVPSMVTQWPVERPAADYKLVVGANPRFNRNQTFSPPTNSVVVTNEAQLQLLIEQEKKVRQQSQ